MQKDINFNCPNCYSNKYKSKTTMGKNIMMDHIKMLFQKYSVLVALWIFPQTYLKILTKNF